MSLEVSSQETSEISSEGDLFETSKLQIQVSVKPPLESMSKRMAAAAVTQVVEAKDGIKEVGGEVGQRAIDSGLSTTSFGNIAGPLTGGAFSVLQAGMSLHAEKIVNGRILNTQRLILSASSEKPFQTVHSEEELVSKLDPLQATSVREATLQSMQYAQQKMESRASKLRLKQAGAAIGLGSTILSATGVGAVIGGGGALLATAVSFAPEVYGSGRAAYKHYQGTKGVAREKASRFIWGLGLSHAVATGSISRESVESDPDAREALEHIEIGWGTVHTEADLQDSREIASKFLEGLHVPVEKLATKKGLAKIMSRFKSTPGG